MSRFAFPLRPFLPADTMDLRELFAASIEELTADDYDEDQRAAWVTVAADADAFRERLQAATTLVVEIEGQHLGFGSLKGNREIDMLYVHPWHAGEGVGTALSEALEVLAKARGAAAIGVRSTETAAPFFEARGYVALSRDSIEQAGEWLATVTLEKALKPAAAEKKP